MGRLLFLERIGNAAAVLSKRWGGVTRRANEAGCSRQAAYKNAARLGRSLELPETHPDLEAILQENQRLGRENATLRKEAVPILFGSIVARADLMGKQAEDEGEGMLVAGRKEEGAVGEVGRRGAA